MHRYFIAALALFVFSGPVSAGTVYTDRDDWLAALSEVSVSSLSLTPQSLPIGTSMVTDDEVTLQFPGHHGGVGTSSNGWTGDVHGTIGSPTINLVTFAAPIIAFGADLGIGTDLPWPDANRLAMQFDATYVRTGADHNFSNPSFFGWIADSHSVRTLELTSAGANNFYKFENVQYVTDPYGLSVVPTPTAALAGLSLMGVMGLSRRRPLTR